MHVLARLLIGSLALLFAVPCGALALCLALLLDPAANAWLARAGLAGMEASLGDIAAGLPPEALLLVVAGLAQIAFGLLVVPPCLVALVGEILRFRALAWYGGACGLLTAFLPWLMRGAVRPGGPPAQVSAEARLVLVLFLVGAVSGFIYWAIAGRHAAGPARPAA